MILLGLVAISSAAAWLLGRGAAARQQRSLRAALSAAFGAVGAGVVFLAVNLVLGMTALLVLRAIAPGLVSLYPLTDQTLAVLSAIQGFTFYAWWTAKR